MSPRLLLRDAAIELMPGETVLAALRRVGEPVLYACEEGCCRSCILRTDAREVPAEAQAGLSAELRAQGAFLACRWAPTADVRIYLPGTLPPRARAAVLVLAGGRSSRMGTPKDAVALADGRTMLEHVLAALRPLNLPIHLSTAAAPSAYQLSHGLPIIADAESFAGPLAAAAHALAHIDAHGLLVVCCDQPLLQTRLLAELLPTHGDERPAFFADAAGASLAPFPGYFPRSAAASIADALAAGVRSPRRWSATHDCRFVGLTAEETATIRSLNSPEDLMAGG